MKNKTAIYQTEDGKLRIDPRVLKKLQRKATHKKSLSVRGESPLEPWMKLVALNNCIDQLPMIALNSIRKQS